jgi:phosphoenolpyruvate synthase/pyruvate phosphate dikinase
MPTEDRGLLTRNQVLWGGFIVRYLSGMESAARKIEILPLFTGGKGVDLARAAKLGLKVPETFSVEPGSLDAWLKSLPGYQCAMESWRAWSGLTSESVPHAITQFQSALVSVPMPSSWSFSRPEISWMVRSSMNLENHQETSFAGAFLSLRVDQADAPSLWRAFLQVIASGYSREALTQVLTSGFDPQDFLPGAILQPVIEAKISGVAFSHDPANPWRRQFVVEWARGSGEGVVQGTKSTHLHRKGDGAAAPEIVDFIELLWRDIELLEKDFGRPVDVEWCWDGSRLWILQVRAVAGVESEILGLSRERFRWTREMAEERFPQPMTILGWTAIDDLVTSNINSLKKDFGIEVKSTTPLALRYRGFVYSDPDFFKFPERVRIHLGLYINPLRARFWKLIFTLFTAGFKRVFSRKSKAVSSALFRMRGVVAFIGQQAKHSHQAWDEHVRINRKKIEDFSKQQFSSDHLLQYLEELRQISIGFLEPDLAIYVVKDTFNQALEKLWTATGHPSHELSWTLNSFEGNRSLQMGEQWGKLVDVLREDRGVSNFLNALEKSDLQAENFLKRETQARWQEFMTAYGHTRTGWDIALPSWREDPRNMAPLLKSTLSQSHGLLNPSAPSAEKVNRFLEMLGTKGLAASEIQWVKSFIATEQAFMQMDEELRFLSGLLLEPSRRLVMLAAEYFVSLKIIVDQTDVFFLSLSELKKSLREPGLCRQALIRKRQSEWSRWKKSRALKSLPVKADAEKLNEKLNEKPLEKHDGAFRLKSASPGKASGPAFFLEHLEDAEKIPRGAILITTAPNPAYVPLYPLLSAMITSTGGPLSHGFVAAREYGIPAVSGWTAEQGAIQPGQWLEVDGSLGTVRLVDKPVGFLS